MLVLALQLQQVIVTVGALGGGGGDSKIKAIFNK
jgi:hypothetical protein